ncbi:SPASM domain-containing protein [Streptosporangium saharense]|uniref:SPASM domain-containing protein n=1 Tax=Streptosporangium saharense TaxID=1706840 RepID=UPI0036A12BD2
MAQWSLYTSSNVILATSYYSDHADQHDQVTRRAGSHGKTRANIEEAVRRGIPIRASVIGTTDDQRVDEAKRQLRDLGVYFVRIDRTRSTGRGINVGLGTPGTSQLCGRCGDGKAAVNPDGDVWPCVMSRWMVAGNVRETALAEIVEGERWRELVAAVPSRAGRACPPDDSNDCGPASTEACGPAYDES